MDEFGGFRPEALAFFRGLEADNSKAYWQANQWTWEEAVKAPMQAFVAAFPPEFQPFRFFRMNRDLRFSKDKSPYKTMIGAVNERPGGSLNYVHLAASGLLAASGQYVMARDQVDRFREAVADGSTGAEFESILGDIRAAGNTVGPGGEAPLRTAPRGYPADHSRIDLLRWKGAIASTEIADPTGLPPEQLVADVTAFWRAAAPLNDWLDHHVGPSSGSARRSGRGA